jgi:hypothetical protein
MKGRMNHAKTSFSTDTFAGAIISVVQYLAPLRYVVAVRHHSNGFHVTNKQNVKIQDTLTCGHVTYTEREETGHGHLWPRYKPTEREETVVTLTVCSNDAHYTDCR